MTENAATPRYIELRCRSAFSFLAGASLPEELIARAAALEYPALALGDLHGVYGAPRFHRAAKEEGLRAIVGCELTLQAVARRSDYAVRANTTDVHHNCLTANHLTATSIYVLAATRIGYQHLCRLITEAKLRAPKGATHLTWDDLDGQTDGLICLAGGAEGPIATALPGGLPPRSSPAYGNVRRGGSPVPSSVSTAANGGRLGWRPDLSSVVCRLQSLFPNRMYIDLQRHLDPAEERLNQQLIAVARHYRIPLVATNDVRHATPDERRLLDVLTCIQQKTTLDGAGRRLLKNAERHLKSSAQMVALFRDLPDAIANTQHIAAQCEFTLANLGYRFPEYPLPPGETAIGHLRALTDAGAHQRYGVLTARVRHQLEHELGIIGKLDLAGYFLIVWDIVRFCREHGILAQGRGSAANSAVCYALGITAVDAVGMDLLFERFLSEERGEWPDIDIDLPSGDQRERVIQYVYQRYGERGAAMTANVITYRTRSAVREVGKALGFSLAQVDKLSKLLNRFEFRDHLDELTQQLRAGGVDAAAPRVRQLVDLVQRIQNLPRHLGQHSGGMVIAAGRLDAVVPLENASMPGRVVVQWDKDDCADLGIIKVDLLGLGMMAVLEETIPLIREHEHLDIDLAHLPPDDPETYAMLRQADTIGVFQVESRAQMATLPRMQPECFYDLVVEVAIIRPGPIVGQMVHPYLNRRRGREPVTYAHPDLEPILKRTLGVPLFQEQLLRMAMTLAGFTGGEAEELRRAMGFKRSAARMQQIEARLRTGMARRGIVGATAEDIIRSITAFALYGFPESHAASFALLAYASAYLRAHHLGAFTCAMLNNWPLGFYHPATLVKDAQRHGLHVLPIDVTKSGWHCKLERAATRLDGYAVMRGKNLTADRITANRLALRLGLRFVQGLREEAGRCIEAEHANAPFISIADVIHRCNLRDNEVQTLAHLGTFTTFGCTRREALWQASAVARGPLFTQKRIDDGYGTSNPLAANRPASRLPEMSPLDRTLADYTTSGITIGPHIMHHLRERLAGEGVLRATDLRAARNGTWVKIAGLVIVRQRPGTAKGFCFLTLEDETGTANAVVVPDMFARYRAVIHTAALLLVEGPLQKVDGVTHVRARRMRTLTIPQQSIGLTGSGYRMRMTPEERATESDQHLPALPKSHDFR